MGLFLFTWEPFHFVYYETQIFPDMINTYLMLFVEISLLAMPLEDALKVPKYHSVLPLSQVVRHPDKMVIDKVLPKDVRDLMSASSASLLLRM